METLALAVLLVAVAGFILVLIFQKKCYNFNSKARRQRVVFFNRYKNGDKLKPGDKALFEELLKAGLVTTRGTECHVSFTHKGRLILTKEEFDARCDLRAKVLKLFSVIR